MPQNPTPITVTDLNGNSLNPIPVSATFSGTIGTVAQGTAANLAGAWTVQITDTTHGPATVTSASALKVDGSAVNQPVELFDYTGNGIHSTSNALNVYVTNSTSGSNAAAGATGSAVPSDADYLGFNTGGNLVGVSSSNPLPITVENSTLAVTQSGTWTVATNADASIGAGSAPSKALIVGGVYNSSAPSPSNGQTLGLQLDSAGRLIVNVGAGSSGNAAASATGSSVPSDADYLGINVGGTLYGQTGVNPAGAIYAASIDIASIAGGEVLTGSTGLLKVAIVGSQGGVFDAHGQNASGAGLSEIIVGGQYNSSPTTITSGNMSPIQLDSSGNLKVNVVAGSSGNAAASATGSGVPTDADYIGFNSSGNLVGVSSSNPLPITVENSTLAVTQSGTWTVGISASQTVAVTQATASSLNATVVGTGTFVVQDSADMSGTTPGTAPSKTLIVGGIYNSSAPSPSSGQTLPFQLDSSGRLIVNVGAGSSGNAAASATGSSVPSDADYIGFNSGGNLVGVSSSNPLPITVENSTLAVTQSGTWTVGISASQTIAVTNTGTFAVQAAQSTAANLNATVVGTGTFAVQATQSGTWDVVPQPATSGGCSTNVQQALTTDAQVKSTAGQLYGYQCTNPNGSMIYLMFYNTTSTPSIGSTTNLLYEIGIQAGLTLDFVFDLGMAFSSGIYVAVATTATGNTAPGTGVVVTSIYK